MSYGEVFEEGYKLVLLEEFKGAEDKSEFLKKYFGLEFVQVFVHARELVKQKYEIGGTDKEVVGHLEAHIGVILDYAFELALNEGLDKKETELLLLATELHDVDKKDAPLVKHGFEGAGTSKQFMKDNGYSDGDGEIVSGAVERHMGPVPGFMQDQADKWNKEHPDDQVKFPKPENKIDQLLYDADMLSLINEQGIGKILTIRKKSAIFANEDLEIATQRGIKQEQVAFESALKSAKEALASFYTEGAKKIGQELLNQAIAKFEAEYGKYEF